MSTAYYPHLAVFIVILAASCMSRQTAIAPPQARSEAPPLIDELAAKQEQQVRQLIEQLVFAESEAGNEPFLSPGIADGSQSYRKRFEKCRDAFHQLSDLKQVAFPFLIEHLNDKRQSINFRNHFEGNSLGDACYWMIYIQLQDRPKDYSSYGYSRKGRDGKQHRKPYWEGTPFDEAGGLNQWLGANETLSYTQMQIKCLSWLLEKEEAIGASDAESHLVNILPLEIRLLERRLEAGEDVGVELERLQ